MTSAPKPMSEERLQEIEATATKLCGHGIAMMESAAADLADDVPELVAEVRRLRVFEAAADGWHSEYLKACDKLAKAREGK